VAREVPPLHPETVTKRFLQLVKAAGLRKVRLHDLRHGQASLLQTGVDTSVIALWLGHVSVDTTQIYLHADLETEGEGTGPDPPTIRSTRAIPTTRQPAGLARSALIMSTLPARNPCPARESATTSA